MRLSANPLFRNPPAFTLALLVLAMIGMPMDDAEARSGGIDGYSGNPATNGGNICNACHSGGQTPTVVLSGPTLVMPSTVNTYTLTVSGGQEVAGGLDVSATSGNLVVLDPGTYLRNGEITHTAPRAVDGNGAVSWSFNWTAPVSEGTVVLYGAGNSVNLGNGNNGDRAGSDLLTISVAAAAPGPGETSGAGSPPLRVTDRDPVTGVMALSYESGCETTGNNIYFGALGDVSTLAWSGEVCDIGTSGTFSSFDPGPGSVFFVVVGNDGLDEGSYGRDGGGTERPDFAGNLCGQVQTLADRCD